MPDRSRPDRAPRPDLDALGRSYLDALAWQDGQATGTQRLLRANLGAILALLGWRPEDRQRATPSIWGSTMKRSADHSAQSPPTIQAIARVLGIDDSALIAAAICAADYPIEISALQQLLDLIEAFKDLDDRQTRQCCVDFARDALRKT